MKSALRGPALIALLFLSVLPAARAATDPSVYATFLRPPSNVVLTITVTPPKEVVPTPLAPAALPEPAASASWVNLKDYPYAQRATVLAGLPGLEARVSTQIEELKARRATLAGVARTDNWDLAMQEMHRAHTYLRFTSEELAKATPETWNAQRDRVGLAWVRAQDAYGRVKASTTL